MVGEIHKFRFNPRTLDDKIVKDGLESASLLSKEPYYLVGGIATQSYLPTSCRRPTSDIDFSIARALTKYADFKQMTKVMIEYLKDIGYSIETKKRSRAYSLDITDNETSDSLALEFARRNEQNFEKNEKRLMRELENANSKIVEDRGSTYRVARQEDIVIPKLVRSIGSLRRNPDFIKYLPKTIEPLSDEKIARQLSKIMDLREEAMINISNPGLAEGLRFISDLYDIRILSEIMGFNPDYLELVENEWDVFNKNLNERNRLVRALLPKLH